MANLKNKRASKNVEDRTKTSVPVRQRKQNKKNQMDLLVEDVSKHVMREQNKSISDHFQNQLKGKGDKVRKTSTLFSRKRKK